MPKRGPIERELLEMIAASADAEQVAHYLVACLPEVFSHGPIQSEAYENGPSHVMDIETSSDRLPLTDGMDIMGVTMPLWARYVSMKAWFHVRYKPDGEERVRMLPALFLNIYAEGERAAGPRKEVFHQRYRLLDDAIGELHELCRIWEQ